jgi:hypothetical protein
MQMLAAGGEVWLGDEPTLREFPPVRASWATRGEQREVVISGRNGRRVIHGALQAATGEWVAVVRERRRQDDGMAFIERLGQVRPGVPKLRIGDTGILRPHTTPTACGKRLRTPRSPLPGCLSGRPS